MTGQSKKPLWECPTCGQRFVTRNMSHSCGRYGIDEHFEKKEPHVRVLFDLLVARRSRRGGSG